MESGAQRSISIVFQLIITACGYNAHNSCLYLACVYVKHTYGIWYLLYTYIHSCLYFQGQHYRSSKAKRHGMSNKIWINRQKLAPKMRDICGAASVQRERDRERVRKREGERGCAWQRGKEMSLWLNHSTKSINLFISQPQKRCQIHKQISNWHALKVHQRILKVQKAYMKLKW